MESNDQSSETSFEVGTTKDKNLVSPSHIDTSSAKEDSYAHAVVSTSGPLDGELFSHDNTTTRDTTPEPQSLLDLHFIDFQTSCSRLTHPRHLIISHSSWSSNRDKEQEEDKDAAERGMKTPRSNSIPLTITTGTTSEGSCLEVGSQLQQWTYESERSNMTFAEVLEKRKWEFDVEEIAEEIAGQSKVFQLNRNMEEP